MKSVAQVTTEVFSHPTAPYREGWVLQHIENELIRLRVPYFKDRWGNIVAGVSDKKTLKKSSRVALVAHTDHPGFHFLKKVKKDTWLAQWFGGYPPKTHRAQVAFYHPSLPHEKGTGVIESKKFFGPQKNLFQIKVLSSLSKMDALTFGAFDYPGFLLKGDRVQTRAADDLSGVSIILGTFERLPAKARKNMLGLFTRGEETGFKGALGFLSENILGEANQAISLEASRQLIGARIGKGPVIRLGDKKTLFDFKVIASLDLAAQHCLKKDKGFLVQRRIMDGGTCEGTAFNYWNIGAAGMAIPLGNYHNQRPNGKPGPEFISIRDVERAVDLCVEFFTLRAQGVTPVKDYAQKLKKSFNEDRPYLLQKIEFQT